MGMFDSCYFELTCPFCGYEYKYSPPTYDKAKADLDKWRVDAEDDYTNTTKSPFNKWRFLGMSPEEVKIYLENMNSDEAVRKYISGKQWGLCEVQTKEFESTLANYFIGDLAGYAHYGHYFVSEGFLCKGCCYNASQPYREVSCWIEMDSHIIKAALVNNPETDKPERREW